MRKFKHIILSLLTVSCSNSTTHFAGAPTERTIATADAAKAVKKSADDPELVREFNLTKKHDADIRFFANSGESDQNFTLISRYAPTSMQFNQITRQAFVKTFKQGSSGTAVSQSFKQSDRGILDLLIVIDNSGSMSNEQVNLSTKLAPLLEYIKDSDWQIGVVTTDPSNGCSRSLIKKNDLDIATKFSNAINAGLAGSVNEQGIYQAVAGLNCSAAPLVRNGSTVAVLIVSDEDNCSDSFGCVTADKDATYLTNYLSTNLGRKLGSEARVYGLYWIPGTLCSTGYHQANIYAQAVSLTSGTAGSICDADYTNTLSTISRDVALILKSDFALSSTPDAGSVVVKFNGSVITTGYVVQGNILKFSQIPHQGTVIDVTYSAGASPIQSRFSIGKSPAPGTLKVDINGITASDTTYSFDPAKNEVVFKTPPVALADIRINFLENVALIKDFSLGGGVKQSSVAVKVNGSKVTSGFTLSSSNVIIFLNPPQDGARIDVDFEVNMGPILEYTLPLVSGTISDMTANYINGGPVVDVAYTNGKIVLTNQTQFIEDKIVTLHYRVDAGKAVEITLPHTPVPGSIQVTSGSTRCAEGQGVTVLNKKISITCTLDPAVETSVAFVYRDLPIRTVHIPELESESKYRAKVSLSGNDLFEYSILQGDIIIKDSVNIPDDSILRVQIKWN